MRFIVPAILLAALTGGPALAQKAAPAAPAKAPAESTMEIVAQSTVYDGKAHTYQVKGNVRITLPQLTVTCDQATVYANDAENQIVKVVFSGNVEAKKGTDSFRATRITYMVAERRLSAEGTTRTRLKLPAEGPIQGP
jgi:lipopolysaccharide export system protein LptA